MRGRAITIVTNKVDSHADAVIRLLKNRHQPVFRLNTEDLGSRHSTTIRCSQITRWTGDITNQVGRQLELHRLRVVWLRKPSVDFEIGRPLSPESGRLVHSELRALLDTIYTLPNIVWVNNPFACSRAKSKFQQLILAKSLGLEIPRTVITNRPAEARRFFDECKGNVLIKSIYNADITIDGMNRAIPSARVTQDLFERHVESIAICPVQLQEYVEKAFELRVTIIGSKMMTVKIDSQLSEKTREDWRPFAHLCPHTVFDLPQSVRESCREFLRRQEMLYGAMDFIVTPTGRYVFLENNPFGQYLWLEEATGLPMSRAMADLLVGLSRS